MVAEDLAAEYLSSNGYRIINRNYRKPWGEIDIIAEKEGIIAFVEVKASMSHNEGFQPEIRAGWTKMGKVVRTARTFLLSRKYPDTQEWQIDVLSVTIDKERGLAKFKHFKNVDL